MKICRMRVCDRGRPESAPCPLAPACRPKRQETGHGPVGPVPTSDENKWCDGDGDGRRLLHFVAYRLGALRWHILVPVMHAACGPNRYPITMCLDRVSSPERLSPLRSWISTSSITAAQTPFSGCRFQVPGPWPTGFNHFNVPFGHTSSFFLGCSRQSAVCEGSSERPGCSDIALRLSPRLHISRF
jgi:hypothetical protein